MKKLVVLSLILILILTACEFPAKGLIIEKYSVYKVPYILYYIKLFNDENIKTITVSKSVYDSVSVGQTCNFKSKDEVECGVGK